MVALASFRPLFQRVAEWPRDCVAQTSSREKFTGNNNEYRRGGSSGARQGGGSLTHAKTLYRIWERGRGQVWHVWKQPVSSSLAVSLFSPYGESSIVMYMPCVMAAHRVAELHESTPVEILNVSNCHAKDIRLLACYTEFPAKSR